MILRFFAFANRLNEYKGKLKSFLNDYMGKYAPQGEADIQSQATMFRQAMNNVWVVFGDNSGEALQHRHRGPSLRRGQVGAEVLDLRAGHPGVRLGGSESRQGPGRRRADPGDVRLSTS